MDALPRDLVRRIALSSDNFVRQVCLLSLVCKTYRGIFRHDTQRFCAARKCLARLMWRRRSRPNYGLLMHHPRHLPLKNWSDNCMAEMYAEYGPGGTT
jgi:hypothetical protein